MRGRPRRGAAHHPTCSAQRRLDGAQAAPLAAPAHALLGVRERERQLGGRIVPVQRHRARLGRRRALARQQRRYLRLYLLERVRRWRLVLHRRHPRYRQFLPWGRRVFGVNFLPWNRGGRFRRGQALARRRQIVDAAEGQPDLAEHLRVVGLLVAVSTYRIHTEAVKEDGSVRQVIGARVQVMQTVILENQLQNHTFDYLGI